MSDQNAAGQSVWRWNDPAQEAARQARHEVLIDLLGAYVDGELPAETVSQLDAHLVGCARCRREVQVQLSLRDHLAQVPVEPATPALRDRLLAATAAVAPTNVAPAGVGMPFVDPTPATVRPMPSRSGRARQLIVGVALVVVGTSWGVWRGMTQPTSAVAVSAPVATVPLLAEVAADYRRVAATDLPGPARDLAAVRAATGLPVEPIANPRLRLIGAWTTSLGGEQAAVLAYRWDDRTVVQYIVPDQLFFRHPTLRTAAAAHRVVAGAEDSIGVIAWPVADAGAVLVGDGSPERLAGVLVR